MDHRETAFEVHGRLNFRSPEGRQVLLGEQPVKVLREIARLHGIVAMLGGQAEVDRLNKRDLLKRMRGWF